MKQNDNNETQNKKEERKMKDYNLKVLDTALMLSDKDKVEIEKVRYAEILDSTVIKIRQALCELREEGYIEYLEKIGSRYFTFHFTEKSKESFNN